MKKKEDLAHIWVESGNIFSENICFAIIPFISNVLSYINAFFFSFFYQTYKWTFITIHSQVLYPVICVVIGLSWYIKVALNIFT